MTIATAFVTGSTGLLGSNLVRSLVSQNVQVRALARSVEKAALQFPSLSVEVVLGDISSPEQFASRMRGCDVVFHTAAYFRESYQGGSHWKRLHSTNVVGTRKLIEATYAAGVRNFVHTSSIAVLKGDRHAEIDETMLRPEKEADDYYRSKMQAERAVLEVIAAHPDMKATMILPGWMWGPGDAGPTSAGQLCQDFLAGKIPGVAPGTFSLVDARDVAAAMIAAAEHGRSGERYLAAGRHVTMGQLFEALQAVSGIEAPARAVPVPLLYVLALLGEAGARIVGKPALLSMASARLMIGERERTRFGSQKFREELGLQFRPIDRTLSDTIDWYRANPQYAGAAVKALGGLPRASLSG